MLRDLFDRCTYFYFDTCESILEKLWNVQIPYVDIASHGYGLKGQFHPISGCEMNDIFYVFNIPLPLTPFHTR